MHNVYGHLDPIQREHGKVEVEAEDLEEAKAFIQTDPINITHLY